MEDAQILIAEDNLVNYKIASRLLQKWGAATTHAWDGLEVLAKLKTERFDLILLDLEMPKLNGFDTASIIRGHASPEIAQLMVLAFSAHETGEIKAKARQAGINGFISKPFTSKSFYESITAALKEMPKA